jgi:hypothetical protein
MSVAAIERVLRIKLQELLGDSYTEQELAVACDHAIVLPSPSPSRDGVTVSLLLRDEPPYSIDISSFELLELES